MVVLEYCAKYNKIEENAHFMRLWNFYCEAQFSMLSLQINAKVAGKPVVITEASIRVDLLFNDVDGIDSVAEGEDSRTSTESQSTPSPTQPSTGDQPPLTESSLDHYSSQDPRVDLEGTSRSGGDQVNLPHDSPLPGGHTSDIAEGSLNLEALYALCTNLSNMVLALESKKKLSKKKSASKQGRKNVKSGPTKDDSDKLDAELDEDIEYIDTEEALKEGMLSIVDTARPDDDTAKLDVSTAGPTTTPITSTIFDDEEMNLANTLIKLKDDKANGVAFKDSESTDRLAILILTLKPLPTINLKDKVKGVLEEPESVKKMNKSDFAAAQIARDEEIARQLELELQAKVERETQREEQASMDYIANLYDEVQARIDADHELAELIADFVPIGSEKDERMIRDMNKKIEKERKDGTEIHMLAERRYPLTTRTLERMLSLRLITESASDAAYDLLRFIQKQIDESREHDRGEKDL
nr:hypothetical protein [Tanacetum cinerariifolium]